MHQEGYHAISASRERCIIISPKRYHDIVFSPLLTDSETLSSLEIVKSTDSN